MRLGSLIGSFRSGKRGPEVSRVTHQRKGRVVDDVDDVGGVQDEESVGQLEQDFPAVAIAQGSKNGNRTKISPSAFLTSLPHLRIPYLKP